MTTVVLGVDIGTSGCKTVAVNAAGEVLASSTSGYPLYSDRPGWSEQDPRDWWQAARDGIIDVMRTLGGHEVIGIGLSGQMHGLVALDRDDQVIRRAILWNDQRCAAECEEITEEVGGFDRLVTLINNRMLPGFTGGKIRWLKTHEPDLFAQMVRLCLPKDYLRLQLTGELVTDESDASGTGMFHPGTRQWASEVVAACGVTEDMLPQVVPSTGQTGTLLPAVAAELGLPAGVPVFGGGGDAVIQTTSMGVFAPGDVGITLGTAGIVAASTDFCPENTDARIQVSAGNAPGSWHLMGVSLSAGGAFQWFGEVVAQFTGIDKPDFDALARLAATAPVGSEGLLFLPYLNGERSPHVAPTASAAFVGLSRVHGARHFARAVMEGVLLNLRRILAEFDALGVPYTRIIVSGGASRSEIWLQILADVCHREVVTLKGSAEGGAFGAALAAGIGAGVWEHYSDVLDHMEEEQQVQPDPARAAAYERIYAAHAELFGDFANVYERLSALGSITATEDNHDGQ